MMGMGPDREIKGVAKDNEDKLPLIFVHTYDDVEINTTVPWTELGDHVQKLARRVVDFYRMHASIKVEADVQIKSLNITGWDEDFGLAYSLVCTVEAVGDDDLDDIDIEALFEHDDDEYEDDE
jgi:hypothetical protein